MNRGRSLHSVLKLADRPHMVDMCMRANNLLRGQPEFLEARKDLLWCIAGVDDNGLASRLVSKNGSVALQPTDRKGFNDHLRNWLKSAFT